MSWRDRAIQADAVPPASGGWRSRAVPAEERNEMADQRDENDILGNAGRDIVDLGKGIATMATKAVKIPTVEAFQTGRDLAQGKEFSETPIGQDISQGKEIVKAIPGAIVDRVKELATDPVGSFKRHPVNTALDVASVAFPVAKAAGAGKMLARGGRAAAEATSSALRAGGLETGQRSLGYTKRLLKTPQAQSEAKAATEMAVRKGIIQAGDDGKKMLDRVNTLLNDAGKRMDAYLSQQNAGLTRAKGPRAAPDMREQFLFDPNRAAAELEKLRPRFRGGDWDKLHDRIDRAVQTVRGAGNRPIPWTQAQEIKELFQSMADWKSNREATILDRKLAGIFRQNMDDQLENVAMARGNLPGFEDFKQAKREFQLGSRTKDALLNRISSDVGNNAISLTDLVLAAPNIASGNFLATAAVGAGKKLLERRGGSAVTVGALDLAEKVKRAPQAFGKYAQPLAKAAERGSQSLAITHFLLEQRDPEYRKQLEAIENGEAGADEEVPGMRQ